MIRLRAKEEAALRRAIKTRDETKDKWAKMCQSKNLGGRPIHRVKRMARNCQEDGEGEPPGFMASEQKESDICPLIPDPTAGKLTPKLTEVCQQFEKTSGFIIAVVKRAWDSVMKSQSH